MRKLEYPWSPEFEEEEEELEEFPQNPIRTDITTLDKKKEFIREHNLGKLEPEGLAFLINTSPLHRREKISSELNKLEQDLKKGTVEPWYNKQAGELYWLYANKYILQEIGRGFG